MIKDSLYVLLTGNYIEGVTDLDRLIEPAVRRIFRKKMQDYVKNKNVPPLNPMEAEKVETFFRPYEKTDLLFHRGYKAWSGKFSPLFIPDDMYYGTIEPFYTDRLTSKYLDNKCFYYRFFSNVALPELIAMRIGGIWLDKDFNIITLDDAASLLDSQPEAVLKKATDSEGGFGLTFLEGDNKSRTFLETVKLERTDLVLQKRIHQHSSHHALNPSSVNTFRIMSMLRKDGVWVFATALRIGRAGSRVDNLCNGGVWCGVREDGHLSDIGTMEDGTVVTSHPDYGYKFSDITLPCYEKAVALVKEAHGIMAHCALASWDVAIDESGEAVLIEANLSLGTLYSMQVCLGPIFGDRTKEILDEVFYKKDGSRRKKPFLSINPRDVYYIRDNIKGILFGSYKQGYTHSYLLSNAALSHIDKKLIEEVSWRFPKLSARQEKEIRDYYEPYCKHFTTESHRVYTGKSGVFKKEYIPEDMYMCHIDRYLSDRNLAYYLDNKCYYKRLFPEAKQPETLLMRIGKIWLDKDYHPIKLTEALPILFKQQEVVVKPATGSEGGAGISFLSFEDKASFKEKLASFKEAVKALSSDIIIQMPVKQHPELSKLHPQSLNTLRIVSLIIEDRVVILSRSLKIGSGSSRMDNGCSGGIYCGIDDSGRLREIGALDDGRVVRKHPELGYDLSGIQIPCLDKCEELIAVSHPFMGHHRLISWDIAIDNTNEAVLIEANLSLGGSDDVQVVNGPFFGEYTERILKEVYGHH
ncbi:MAG: hypothetical protein E7241_01900 [Lachnospiraceae bacterium]|jgi:hypothetical protein|nr:hypothetical protein [Lachnospiraceae bacterium]